MSPTIWLPDIDTHYNGQHLVWRPANVRFPYNSGQISEIKNALLALPMTQSFAKEDGNLLHLAFWQEGQLRVCDYTRHEAEKALYKLGNQLGYSVANF